jgi:hypothetical protein
LAALDVTSAQLLLKDLSIFMTVGGPHVHARLFSDPITPSSSPSRIDNRQIRQCSSDATKPINPDISSTRIAKPLTASLIAMSASTQQLWKHSRNRTTETGGIRVAAVYAWEPVAAQGIEGRARHSHSWPDHRQQTQTTERLKIRQNRTARLTRSRKVGHFRTHVS